MYLITRKDVAEMAGVSVATVSHVINERYKICQHGVEAKGRGCN